MTDQHATRFPTEEDRLDHYIARCGAASRRAARKLVKEGLVKVDGRIVTDPGTHIEPGANVVELEGERLKLEKLVYYKLNKPRGYVTAMKDYGAKPCVAGLLSDQLPARIFPVGRLDMDSEGLLLMTNDGDLSFKLMHPSFEVPRRYLVRTSAALKEKDARRALRGVEDKGEKLKLKEVRYGFVAKKKEHWLEVVLTQGKKREIRRLLKCFGLKVLELRRTEYGPVKLGRLKPGSLKKLSSGEIAALKNIVG